MCRTVLSTPFSIFFEKELEKAGGQGLRPVKTIQGSVGGDLFQPGKDLAFVRIYLIDT